MTRRVVLHLALSLGVLGSISLPALAAVAPPPQPAAAAAGAVTPVAGQTGRTTMIIDGAPTLTELSYERLLEESLRQSLSAYLGPDQFLLQVRVGITQVRDPQSVAPAPIAPQPQTAWQAPPPPPDEPAAAEIEAAPGLPGLPGISADDRPTLERRTIRRQPPAVPPQPQLAPQAPQTAAAPTYTQHIDRIRISLVLPNTLKATEEDFIKNLVFQRADLNLARGDTLDISHRDFPRAAGAVAPGLASTLPGAAPTHDIPGWLWGVVGALGTATLLLAVGALTRRRPEMPPQMPFANLPAPVPAAPAPAASAESLLASLEAARMADPGPVRQELLVALLENPDAGQRYLRRVLGEEGGLAKAAILTKAIGSGLSKRLFAGMTPEEWRSIDMTALDQKGTKGDEQRAVLEEAYTAILKDQVASMTGDKTSPFAFLNTLDDSQLVYLMEDEGPRVQALVLSQLPADRAVGLMRLKTPAEQGAIAAAMGELHLLPLSAFHDLAHHLAEKAAEAPTFETAVTNGLGLLVNLLDHSDRTTEQGILSGLSSQNPRLFAQVREAYLTFDDLAKVPREVLKDALREIEKETLAEALRDAPEGVKEAVIGSLTDRARRIVEESLQTDPVAHLGEAKIEAIRKDLVSRVRQLMAAGRFTMKDLQIAKENA